MSDIVERLRSTNALPIIRPTKLEREAADEIERLRAGLQLIANDKNRLMNEVARQTAASILGGLTAERTDEEIDKALGAAVSATAGRE